MKRLWWQTTHKRRFPQKTMNQACALLPFEVRFCQFCTKSPARQAGYARPCGFVFVLSIAFWNRICYTEAKIRGSMLSRLCLENRLSIAHPIWDVKNILLRHREFPCAALFSVHKLFTISSQILPGIVWHNRIHVLQFGYINFKNCYTLSEEEFYGSRTDPADL